jgi:vacuolar protein sorting-associated protein 35
LQLNVDIKTVLSALMDRLSNYAASSPEVSIPRNLDEGNFCIGLRLTLANYMQVLPEFLQVEAFTKFSNAIGKVRL